MFNKKYGIADRTELTLDIYCSEPCKENNFDESQPIEAFCFDTEEALNGAIMKNQIHGVEIS